MLSRFLCLSALVCAITLSAVAGTVNNFPWPPTSNGDGTFTWGYSLSIGGGESVANGNYFIVYDFAGLQGTPTAPADWAASTQFTSPSPSVILNYTDDPSIQNLVFTYIGNSILTGPQTFTGFTAISNTDTFVLKDGFARTSNQAGLQSSDNAIASPAVVNTVPEPSSIAFILTGAVGALGTLRKRFSR